MSELVSPVAASPLAFRAKLAAYVELAKPRLTSLVLVTVAAGFAAALPAGPDWVLLLQTVAAVGLVAGGGGALNMYLERDLDLRMHRTRTRPIPSGRLTAIQALAFGVYASVAGLAWLWVATNELATFFAALALTNYVFVYTPLKVRTSLNTLVGAVTGALPPVIGWAAASGGISAGAGLLFAILFVWQMPHFLVIAWLCRDDYARAGMKMISVLDPTGGATMRQIVLFSLTQLPVSLLPVASGLAGIRYFLVASAVSLAMAVLGVAFAARRSKRTARWLFLASLLYLPLVLGTFVWDRIGA
ncbi:MAG: protoheme IX farnesyltransferase [Planctomycetes bacterium]|nr:protoheme IX farnesyltransferase [Planctomycetota bacterium]